MFTDKTQILDVKLKSFNTLTLSPPICWRNSGSGDASGWLRGVVGWQVLQGGGLGDMKLEAVVLPPDRALGAGCVSVSLSQHLVGTWMQPMEGTQVKQMLPPSPTGGEPHSTWPLHAVGFPPLPPAVCAITANPSPLQLREWLKLSSAPGGTLHRLCLHPPSVSTAWGVPLGTERGW